MTQYARPDSDIGSTNWSSGSYTDVDEVSPSDADYLESNALETAFETASFEVGLSNITDPEVSTGHQIKVRARVNISWPGTMGLNIYVKEGVTIRSTDSVAALTNTWTTYTFTLSAAQADSISNYNSLRVLVEGSNDVDSFGQPRLQVSWIEFSCPDAPVAGSRRIFIA